MIIATTIIAMITETTIGSTKPSAAVHAASELGSSRLASLPQSAVVEDIISPLSPPPCAGCGRCCHLVVELRPGDDVPGNFIVEHAGIPCMDQRADGACVALDPATFLCTIYEDRPQTCREFSRGGELCRRTLSRS
jgi:uncharacterized protein